MPAAEVIALDEALVRAGEDILIRRQVNGVPVDVTCRAAVRGVRPEQIVGTIAATDLQIVISPTQILAMPWPDATPPVAGQADPHIPRITDIAVIKGKQRQVKFSDPIFVGGEWVRCNLIVAG